MIDYNFFEIYTKKKDRSINVKSPIFLAVVIIAVFALLTLGVLGRNIILAMDLSNMNQEIQTKTASKEYIEANRIQEKLDAMKQYDSTAEDILKKFQEVDLISSDILKALTASLPGSVKLASLTMDNANASFVFNAPDRKSAAELLLNLNKSGLFWEVELAAITSDPNGGGILSVNVNAVMKAGESK